MLDTFIEIAPAPFAHQAVQRTVTPYEKNFSGFIFKIHANLDPNHRDRIAFLRICSGKFERNKFYYHTRLEKKLRFSNPTSFMANEKSLIDKAYPGDVIGLYDSGNFKIGDTLSEGEKLQFKGIPSFSPQIFKEVINKDPLRTKKLDKGIRQLMEEGVAQFFIQQPGNRKIIGTVGELQFDVIKFRLLQEYGAACDFNSVPYFKACWLTSNNDKYLQQFINLNISRIGLDKDANPVYFAESQWMLKTIQDLNPEIVFHNTSEFKLENLIV